MNLPTDIKRLFDELEIKTDKITEYRIQQRADMVQITYRTEPYQGLTEINVQTFSEEKAAEQRATAQVDAVVEKTREEFNQEVGEDLKDPDLIDRARLRHPFVKDQCPHALGKDCPDLHPEETSCSHCPLGTSTTG